MQSPTGLEQVEQVEQVPAKVRASAGEAFEAQTCTRLHRLTSASGFVVFDALLIARRDGTQPQPLFIGGLSPESDEFLDALNASASVAAHQYELALTLACQWGGYDLLAHASLPNGGQVGVAAKAQVPPNKPITPEMVQQWVQSTFDRLHAAHFTAAEHVWLARAKLEDDSPQPWEWGIHQRLAGVALPDAMTSYFLAQAAERACDAHSLLSAPAPGQGG